MSKNNLVAVGIGAEKTITTGNKCLIFKRIKKGKRVGRKRIPEITEKQIGNYKSIGVAEGQDLFHCIYLASKYAKNFDERVAAYRIVKPTQKGCSFAVNFYEKKPLPNK